MSSDRKKVPLSELITLQRGFDLPSKDRIDGTVPVVASTQITGWHNESKVEGPGVVIGRSGSIGGGQFIKEDFWPLNTTLWVKNFKNHDPEFVYYLLRSIDFERFNVGSGVPTLNRNHLSSVKVPLFNEEEEFEIANQLGTLDQKNHLNQQTNETLEAMAQAIFKSWFVDFDPVRAKIEASSAGRDPNRAAMAAIAGVSLEQGWDEIKAALDQKLSNMTEEQRQQLTRTAELFPDELVESEIGEVPKGWEVKNAEEILKRYRAPKRVKKDEVEETGKVVVLEQGEGIIMGYHNEDAGYNASPDNPYFIFGDHTCITHLVIEPFDIAPNVIPLQGQEFDTYWTYYAIRDLQQFQEYRRHWSELKVKEVVTPNNELDEFFAELIKPLIIKVNKNRNENLTLSQLRDRLLPKLISGERQV